MIEEQRKEFNRDFTENTYKEFLEDLNGRHPGALSNTCFPLAVIKERRHKMWDRTQAFQTWAEVIGVAASA